MKTNILSLTLLLLLTCISAFGQYSESYFTPSELVVTPHISWAKPYAGGPVKALFITTRLNQREVIELAERMSLDYSVFTVGSRTGFSVATDKDTANRVIPGAAAEEMTAKLLKLLEANYDVIVLGSIKWDTLPAETRQIILDKVSHGTGLMGMADGLNEVNAALTKATLPAGIADGIPYTVLPAFANKTSKAAFATTFQYGQMGTGRVLILTGYPTPTAQALTPVRTGPFRASLIDYDYYLAMAIKGILLCAQKEPTITITPLQPAFTTERGVATDMSFQLAGKPTGVALAYEFVIRDHYNNTYPAGMGAVTIPEAGAATLSPTLGPLPAGDYFLDLMLRERTDRPNAPVISFASAALSITSATHIESVVPTKSYFSINGPVTGIVTVTTPGDNQSLRLEVFDNYNRLLATSDMPVNGAARNFSLAIRPPASIVGRIATTLYTGDYQPANLLDWMETDFSFNDFLPETQELRHIVWVPGSGNDFITPNVMNEFHAAGVDTQYTTFKMAIPYANLWHIPYATRLVDSKTVIATSDPAYRKKDELIRDPCLTDPLYRAKLRADLTAMLTPAAPFATTEVSMGDEDSQVSGKFDICMSPTCNEDFRTFLKKEYRDSLAAVNAEWGTDYATWEDVVPITLEQAKQNGHFPQWVDHRRHMESVWADIFAFGREVSQEIVPGARVGYEGSDGTPGSFTGVDYWKLAQSMDLNNVYLGDFHTAVTRDFAAPGTLIGLGWYGGYAETRNEPYNRWLPWRSLLRGANSVWIWNGYGGIGSVMNADLSMESFYRANCQEINEMKAGPAKMLISAKRQHDGIAILWSPSSIHAGTFTHGYNASNTLNSLVRIVNDLGLESKIVSSEQLAKGELKNDEYKVLVLPLCQALSTAEITTIKNFVQGGGHVIADILPGIMDEHGKPYPVGMLNDVFGVKHANTEKYREVVGELKPMPDGFSLGITKTDGNLEEDEGKVRGKVGAVPVMISHQYGRGDAELFNMQVPEYSTKADAKQKEGDFLGYDGGIKLRRLLGNMFKDAGVTAEVTLTPEQPDVEISRFKNGDLQYIGIVQKLARDPLAYSYGQAKPPATVPVRITFPANKYLYNVRTGTYLGQTNATDTMLAPGIAQLYALLPYRVVRIALTTPATAVAGTTITFTAQIISAAAPGTHCLNVRVIDSAGINYTRNILTSNGVASIAIPLALNDPTGNWRMEVKDTASGMKATAEFTVTK